AGAGADTIRTAVSGGAGCAAPDYCERRFSGAEEVSAGGGLTVIKENTQMKKKSYATMYCVMIFFFFLPQHSFGQTTETPLPVWVKEYIAKQKSSNYPDTIEECLYKNKRVFEIIDGAGADTGHEHVLKDEDGKSICEFGGFAGHVTAGSCELDKIIYVRT